MISETIKFTDYNDQEREVTEYFHLNEKEIVDLQARSPEGFEKEMDAAIKSNDAGRVLNFITDLVHRAYGRKSQDGLHFRKSPEILQEFVDSAYYSDFMMSLIQDNGTKGQKFIQGIFPKHLVERAMAQAQGQNVTPIPKNYAPSAREQFEARQAPAQTTEAPLGAFGQPEYPKVEPTPVQDPQMSPEEYQKYLAWKSAQAEPNFRVPAEAPQASVPRPAHEQLGDHQQ